MSAPRRWVFVITHLAPGGTREVLALLHEELGRRGIGLTVLVLYRGGAPEPPPFPCEVLLPGDRLGGAGALRAAWGLFRRLRRSRPGVVLTFMPAANVLGTLVALAAGVPHRFCTHHQPGWTQNRWLKLPDLLLGASGAYSRILTVSRSIETSFGAYPRAYRRRIRVIPNGLAPIAPAQERTAIRRGLGVPELAVLAVAIGRLSPEKNALNTVRAAARVPGLRLVLVGDGPQRAEIEACIAVSGAGGRITLAGHRDRQEAVDILFAADLFLQLSRFEGRSLALLEALGAGKAIVASDIPAQREVLVRADGAVAGLLCDPDDVGAIAAALARAAGDAGLRRRLAALAAEAATDQDPARMGGAYLNLAPA